MARLRVSPTSLFFAGATLLAAFVFIAAITSSDDFLFIPDKAEPVASKVMVQGGREPENGGGIYFVDVSLRKARWLERLLPFLQPDGASLVPQHAVVAPGQSFAEQRVQARDAMDRSEQIAAAVALEAAGYPVKATPTGVLVDAVALDAPAASSLRSGDLIVAARGKPVKTVAELREALAPVEPGKPVTLRIERGGSTTDRKVGTVSSPDDPERAIIGIEVSEDAHIVLPRKVTIDLGNIGGPSAGLPFALQVYQELGKDVDRGLRVAATGEIQLDGTVSSVGGVKQKTFGVREANADVFLVPAGENAATARRYAGGLRVIPVESFRQALHVLQTLPRK
jgi:PDZ domain-containing protein